MSLRSALRRSSIVSKQGVTVRLVASGYIVAYSGKQVPYRTLDALIVFLGDDSTSGWICE